MKPRRHSLGALLKNSYYMLKHPVADLIFSGSTVTVNNNMYTMYLLSPPQFQAQETVWQAFSRARCAISSVVAASLNALSRDKRQMILRELERMGMQMFLMPEQKRKIQQIASLLRTGDATGVKLIACAGLARGGTPVREEAAPHRFTLVPAISTHFLQTLFGDISWVMAFVRDSGSPLLARPYLTIPAPWPDGPGVIIPFGEGDYTLALSIGNAVNSAHLAIVGATGSGKSTLAKYIARIAMSEGTPVVFVDPKGEMAIGDQGIFGCKTLSLANSHYCIGSAGLWIIKSVIESGQTPDVQIAAQEVFNGLRMLKTLTMLDLMAMQSLLTKIVVDVAQQSAGRLSNTAALREMHRGIRDALLRVQPDIESRLGIYSGALLSDDIAAINDTLERITSGGIVVKLSHVPEDQLACYAWWVFSLVLAASQRAKVVRVRRGENLQNAPPILLYIDEAHRIPREIIELLLRIARSAGIAVMLVSQSFEDFSPTALDQLRYVIAMRPSAAIYNRIRETFGIQENLLMPTQGYSGVFVEPGRKSAEPFVVVLSIPPRDRILREIEDFNAGFAAEAQRKAWDSAV